MSNSNSILYSAGKNDECYTPEYGVKPIIKYIPKNWVVWCPFDKEDSQFVKLIKENGNKVIYSHIDNGQDFYTYEPKEHWDCIVSNPPFCFDFKTEIFTQLGWKTYDNLNISDLVLSVNPLNQNLEWTKINSINILDYNDTMLEFKTKTLDILVTPYHRMYGHTIRNKKIALNNSKDDLIQSQNIKKGYMTQFRTGYKWNGKTKDYINIGDNNINIEDWLRFFGLWLADGYCRHTKNTYGNNRYTCGIKQSLKHNDILVNILNKLPFKYSIYIEKNRNMANYEIHNKTLWEYLIQFGKSSKKFIPQEIKELNVNLLNILLESYLFGDSYKIKNGSICISTMSKQLSEDLQEIVLKIGDIINFNEKDLIIGDKNYGKYYLAYWNKGKITNSKYPNFKKVNYNGIVFCPELEKNHIMLVRRNNKIYFSGNTNKRKIFERALSFNKPFALIMNNTWLNDSAPKQLFKDKELQLLMFEKRMKFVKSDGTIENKITFSSSYYCWNFLPKQIIMEDF